MMYGLKTDWQEENPPRYFTLRDYEGAVPRWCAGCGDHAILSAVQRLCRDEQLPPEKTVVVSGIGCASRFPHYVGSYGFHGLHGRALPVACGIRARRPDLHLFVATGDGDCCAIGTGHWVYAVHYNMNMVVMMFDNNVYALTKNQTSPTSPKGRKTNTHPRGAWLQPIDPIQTSLGIQNASFVAQTIDWNPAHLLSTLKAAHHHPGLAFVRVIQRCSHYPSDFVQQLQADPSLLLVLTHPDGVNLDDATGRTFRNQERHDPTNIAEARALADRRDVLPIGLFYRNENADRYDRITIDGIATSRKDKLAAIQRGLSGYAI
jgi:2-oxoglutarate ferredoxin oxidoreductase subunit beta